MKKMGFHRLDKFWIGVDERGDRLRKGIEVQVSELKVFYDTLIIYKTD